MAHRLHSIPEPRRSVYRWVFFIAAIYNLVWGVSVILFPKLGFWLLAIPTDQIGTLGMVFWRCIGMFVMVFAIGYWYSSREPERYAAFILIGTLGKIFGPIGFVIGWYEGIVPGRVGWTLLTNDLIWWPFFVPFVYETIVLRRYEPR
jgi:small multidrug resistance pump